MVINYVGRPDMLFELITGSTLVVTIIMLSIQITYLVSTIIVIIYLQKLATQKQILVRKRIALLKRLHLSYSDVLIRTLYIPTIFHAGFGFACLFGSEM
jgi:hypothetical protein